MKTRTSVAGTVATLLEGKHRALAMLAAATCLAHGLVSPAHGAASATAGFLSCASEQDATKRLACFDAAVVRARIQPEPKGSDSLPAATAPTAAPVLSKEERFGLRGELKAEQAKKTPELAELEELRATVTRVAVKPHGQLILTLDNDQVWYEIQANSGVRVKAGDQVVIRPGALGSFSLVAPNGRSSKVTRSR